MFPQKCELCPRRCGANRTRATGACGAGGSVLVARAAPHHWEEPCLSGTAGSGTVFFSGCGLGCAFCQNHAISRGGAGRPYTEAQLAQLFLQLQRQGVHNLNLVTATPHRPAVQSALALAKAEGFALPVVWNTGGYETSESIAALAKDVDIWLFDLKFFSEALSAKLAGAPDYFRFAAEAAKAVCRLAGPPQFGENGLLLRGVIIRVLVLPGHREDAKQILGWMAGHLPKNSFLLSLMRQYTPPPPTAPGYAHLPKPMRRPLSSYEYGDVCDTARALGLTNGWFQGKESACAAYVPPFDTGGTPGV